MKYILRLALALALVSPGPSAADAAAQAYRAPSAAATVPSGPAVIPNAPAALIPSVATLAALPVSVMAAPATPILPSFSLAASPTGGEPGGEPGEPGWKRKTRAAWAKTKQVLRDTPAEVAILGTFGLMVGLGLGWNHEAAREASIPVGFSEIHQMERDAEYEGRQIGPMARYLAGTNDMTMNVFNAWNKANERATVGSPVPNFASELDYNAGQKLRIHHYELPHYFKSIPDEADAARRLLEPYEQVRLQAADANAQLSRTWDESHHDVMRTEWHTRTVDDGNGRSHTETYSTQVYDHTIHRYSYDRAHGEASSTSLDALTRKGRAASFTEDMPIAKQTNADGEYAAEKSRGLRQALSPQEAMTYASVWKYGSTLMTNLPVIHARLSELARDADRWRGEKNSAHDERYTTTSHWDSGPREYQTVERALSHGRDLERSVSEVLEGVDYTRAMTPVLEAKIQEFIAVQLDRKPGNAKKLCKEILSITKEIYAKNFKKGFDVKRFRAGIVALAALLGAFAGGLLGAGWDWLGKRRGW